MSVIKEFTQVFEQTASKMANKECDAIPKIFNNFSEYSIEELHKRYTRLDILTASAVPVIILARESAECNQDDLSSLGSDVTLESLENCINVMHELTQIDFLEKEFIAREISIRSILNNTLNPN